MTTLKPGSGLDAKCSLFVRFGSARLGTVTVASFHPIEMVAEWQRGIEGHRRCWTYCTCSGLHTMCFVFSSRYRAAWSTGMSSSRPLFRTRSSAYQRAVLASCSCPASASPTSRRNSWPQTCGGLCSTITEREEMSRGDGKFSILSYTVNLSWFISRRVCAYTQIVWGKAERKRVCTQAAEHKELAMCPSPHIWCAGAGSGLGRRSDRPNEISQHTKCLSGPIRIPSCLPWVYLIEGKLTGSRRSEAPIGLAPEFLGLAWAGLGWEWMGWVGAGPPSSVTPQRAAFTPFFSLPLFPPNLSHMSHSDHLDLLCFFPIFHFSLSSFSFLPRLNLLTLSLPLSTSSWDLGNF